MNLSKYQERKLAGLITLSKTEEGVFAIYSKTFDPETGNRLADEVEGFTLESLEKDKANLEAQLAQLNLLIEDCKSL